KSEKQRHRARRAHRPRGGPPSPDRRPAPRGRRARQRGAIRAVARQRRHVRDRQQPELHQRLRDRLPVLRVLPQAGRPRGVDAHGRRGARQGRVRRDQGRHHGAAAGRPQPRAPAGLLPDPGAGDAQALSAGDAALLDHLAAIRELQDECAGFTAFVPWSFKPGNTLLEKWIKQYKGPNTYLRVLAAARLYLDNFPHVQASWFSEGKAAGQIALHFGADDWGGTLFEENVHKAADYVNTISVDEIVTLIRDAGFTPAQRTTEYEILKRY